jgi:hypothetical protein
MARSSSALVANFTLSTPSLLNNRPLWLRAVHGGSRLAAQYRSELTQFADLALILTAAGALGRSDRLLPLGSPRL